MATILDGLELPGDLQWTDETAWDPVAQAVTTTLTGALIIEESVREAGRPITLVGVDDAGMHSGYVKKSVLDQLLARRTPGRQMGLQLHDGRQFTVTFRYHDGHAVEAVPLYIQGSYGPEDIFVNLTIRLMQV